MIPDLTVLMPVYNGSKYIKKAMSSILNQTFKNFEFLIINDGCTDDSVEKILNTNDNRIRLVNNNKNLGIVFSLNKGITLAKGKYIARMDCDDIANPERLEIQYKFMQKYTEIDICGTYVRVFGAKNEIWKYPLYHEAISAQMFFNCVLVHPTVILRKSCIKQHRLYYDSEYIYAEDYELWQRAINHVRFANIPKILLDYRLNWASSSRKMAELQKKQKHKIYKSNLKKIGIVLSNDEFDIFFRIANNDFSHNDDFLKKAEKLLIRLCKKNNQNKYYNEDEFLKTIGIKWASILKHTLPINSLWLRYFLFSPLTKYSLRSKFR